MHSLILLMYIFGGGLNVSELIMIHGSISRYLIKLPIYSCWAQPHPAPHLLHTCLAAAGSSVGLWPPRTVCYMILVQWRAAARDGGSAAGPYKITLPYHCGPSAQHSCWCTLGNPGTRSEKLTLLLSRHFQTLMGGTRCTLMYERLDFGGYRMG